MSTLDGFDAISPVYDGLARMVFGRSIRNAQLNYLEEIREARCILIIGGGSGWLLEEVLKINKNGTVWFVEASSRMIALARKKCKGSEGQRVRYVHGTEASLPSEPTFDAAITNFFFDLFPEERLQTVLGLLKISLTPNAILLATDFVKTDRRWQRLMLSVMYFFFRVTAGIEARQLPLWEMQLKAGGFRQVKAASFYRRFIRSGVYVTTVGISAEE